MRTLLFLAVVAAVTPPSLSAADCDVYWFYRAGKEDPQLVRVPGGWPLIHFSRNAPSWYYGQENELKWHRLSTRAPIRSLGWVGGLRVYEVTYSPLDRVIVWDQGGWSFCPALLAAADETIATAIHEAEVFQWQGTDILHVRVQYAGTGHFQESLFFAAVDGVLTHLTWDEAGQQLVTEFCRTHSLEPFHRGLGFCSGRLVERRLVAPGGAGLVIQYRVDGKRLVAEHVDFGNLDEAECEIFPSP